MPSTSGTLTASTAGSGFDTVLALYSGPSSSPIFGTLTNRACNDDSGDVTSLVSYAVTGGQTYYLQLGGYSGAVGSFSLQVSMAGPTATPTATPMPTPSGSNLALNRPATASSIETASFPASYAVDGSLSTRWSSLASDPQWLQVDLGQSYALNRVILSWEAAYGRAYQIQVSNDASTWTSIYSTSTGDGGTDDLAVSGSGRYVRMYGTARATTYGYSLWEFKVYGSAAPTATATATPAATSTPTATLTPTPTLTPTLTPTPTLASGPSAWGRNNYGQLGDGTATNRSTPIQVSGLGGVVAMAAGDFHSLALKNDGTVRAWGYNGVGQLGDGSTTYRTSPVQVSGLSGVTAIAAGRYHSLAVKGDGSVWAWGGGSSGQLGDGYGANRTTPVQVRGAGGVGFLGGVSAIAAGGFHSLALKTDGTAWAFGNNSAGQLGDGTTANRYTPVQVSGLGSVSRLAAGGLHSLAARGDGSVWAWGNNSSCQLGDGSITNRLAAVQVSGVNGATALAAGYFHSLALLGDGSLRGWGRNFEGQVGDGTRTMCSDPVAASGLSGMDSLGAGFYHSLAGRP